MLLLLKNLSGAKLIAFKKFIADVFAKNINSWTNKDEAEDYAKKLINNNDVTDKNISNTETLTSAVSPVIKTSQNPQNLKNEPKVISVKL